MKEVASFPLRPTTSNSVSTVSFEGSPTAANLRAYAFTYMFRGSVVLTAALSNYALEHVGFAAPWLPWMVLMPLMGMVQSIRARRQAKQEPTSTTAADKTMRLLQKSFLLVLLGAVVGACFVGWAVVHPLLLVLYGLSTWVAGRVLRFRPLLLGGVACGILGLIAALVPAGTQLLLVAGAMLASYVVPGCLLHRTA